MHEAKNLKPNASIIKTEGLNPWIFPPVCRVKLKRWQLQINSHLNLGRCPR